jgi:hypothetical protein
MLHPGATRPLHRGLRRGLVVGLLLVALAGIVQPQAAEASHACVVPETGHLGWRICETNPGRATVGGRRHIFVTGTDYAIWYAWQVRPGGPYSTWHSLHGQAYHNPYDNIYAGPIACVRTTNEVILYVKVLGTDLNFWQRSYHFTGPNPPGWSNWQPTRNGTCGY